jgi:hypothetical protein
MILKYGTYSHAQDTVSLAVTREPVRNERDQRYAVRERWTIDGWLTGADAAALTTAIDALETAYATDGQNLILYLNDGVTPTSHSLASASALGGVRIISGPEYPEGAGAEYAVIRNFRITAEALFEDSSPQALVDYSETIQVTGTGGARRVVIPVLVGSPIVQETATATPVFISQDGQATGLTAYPAANLPVTGLHEHVDRRQISRRNPKRQADGTDRFYEITWHYEFTEAAAATATPTAK